eukprot:4864568-Pyramimonas_sp.AAC.1
MRYVENGKLSRLEYLRNRAANEIANKGTALGRIPGPDRLVVEGCHELVRLVCKYSAEQEARI